MYRITAAIMPPDIIWYTVEKKRTFLLWEWWTTVWEDITTHSSAPLIFDNIEDAQSRLVKLLDKTK
jgi:hypothetical protein